MKSRIFSKVIENAVRMLKNGGVVVYPTETAYALGCDVIGAAAVRRVFKIKKRPLGKTLPLIAGSLAMVSRFCLMSKAELKLARRYWPGPLTMVLKTKEQRTKSKEQKLPAGVVAKDKTVAVRVSSNKIARELSRRLGRPIVSTSANLAGGRECYSLDEVRQSFRLCHSERGAGRRVEESLLLIDGGRLKKIKPSTIVKVKDGKVQVLRQGTVKILNPKHEIRNKF